MADGDQKLDDWAVRLAEAGGESAEVGDAFGVPVFDVPSDRWVETLQAAHDGGLTFFDWLSAVDEQDEGFSVIAHVADMSSRPLLHLLVRTRIAREAPSLRTATSVYRGASWHERETHEMFGITFDGHPNLSTLLLADEFEGHPLRKEFVLAARAAKPWPGAKEPGEGRASPSRRRMQPPGVPDPSWGPHPPGEPADPNEGGAGGEAAEHTSDPEAGGTEAGAKKTTAKKTTAKKAARGRSERGSSGGSSAGGGEAT